jgi:hypothetical protein
LSHEKKFNPKNHVIRHDVLQWENRPSDYRYCGPSDYRYFGPLIIRTNDISKQDKNFFKFDANDFSKNPILKNHDKNK